jgi:hypothetical protein
MMERKHIRRTKRKWLRVKKLWSKGRGSLPKILNDRRERQRGGKRNWNKKGKKEYLVCRKIFGLVYEKVYLVWRWGLLIMFSDRREKQRGGRRNWNKKGKAKKNIWFVE